jgi:hypothetical protein
MLCLMAVPRSGWNKSVLTPSCPSQQLFESSSICPRPIPGRDGERLLAGVEDALRFGALVEEKLDLVQQARPFLLQLRDQVNETIHLAVLDDDLRVVYVEKLSAQHAIGLMMSRIGITAPMHCTALGKAMAAFQPEDEICHWILTYIA